ncbi:MAG TPA: sugar phosphate isomerase/epimerase [bacterium]|nr:sugar phosphate isomerase/epimerase [bacterium]
MQLGISALGHIIEIGSSGNYKNLIDLQLKASEACLNFAEKNRIRLVELVLDPPEMFKKENYKSYIDLISSYSLEKQIHAPFIDVNLCSHNDHISKASVKLYIETIKICNATDIKTLTIHPGLANFLINKTRKFNILRLKQAIQSLLDFSKNTKVSVCLENMPQNTYIMTENNNIEEVFKIIDRQNLFLCYDTSHFYTCDGDVKKLWSEFHEVIRNVHIVDNFSKITDTHPPLGTGKINFKEIFEIMKSYNYKGAFIIELSTAKDLPQSIDFIKKLIK